MTLFENISNLRKQRFFSDKIDAIKTFEHNHVILELHNGIFL